MIVELSPNLFDNPENFQKLNHLFVSFENSKHNLYLNTDISATQWFSETNKTTREFCEIEFVNSSYISKKKIKLKLDEENDIDKKIYSLHDGKIFLENNILIFVENATSDRLFLNCIFKHFNPECDKINSALEKRWIEYKGAGGKNEIIKEINNYVRVFRKEKLNNHLYLKAIVVLDSDKTYPTEELSNTHKNLQKYCADNKIELHILEKREVENYVPLEAFDALKASKVVGAYKALNKTQQSYYDLEKGFNKLPLNKQNAGVQNLFKDVKDDDITNLRNGFNSIDGYNPKSSIPRLFNHQSISRENLTEKGGTPKEFLEIIDKINSLL